MGIIALEGLEFFAYHGFHPEERIIGNRYGVDISVKTDFRKAAEEDKIKYTVNYGTLYEIVKEEMSISVLLLEHLAQKIVQRVIIQFPQVEEVEITIRKFNPPIGGVCKSSKVTLSQSRHSSQ
ncbi:MAG: dihydroneopterin aldolase [Thermoflexibacter sp.]|jgi:dihydroneopterin aldolase|nr:dihydroneopterin aldolase [Thermoflexibacter sp.]